MIGKTVKIHPKVLNDTKTSFVVLNYLVEGKVVNVYDNGSKCHVEYICPTDGLPVVSLYNLNDLLL